MSMILAHMLGATNAIFIIVMVVALFLEELLGGMLGMVGMTLVVHWSKGANINLVINRVEDVGYNHHRLGPESKYG